METTLIFSQFLFYLKSFLYLSFSHILSFFPSVLEDEIPVSPPDTQALDASYLLLIPQRSSPYLFSP